VKTEESKADDEDGREGEERNQVDVELGPSELTVLGAILNTNLDLIFCFLLHTKCCHRPAQSTIVQNLGNHLVLYKLFVRAIC
jgi:hypothetical protein